MRYALVLLTMMICSSCKHSNSTNPEHFKIKLRLSHVFSPKEDLTLSMDRLAARIEEKTQGAVKILTFPQGQIATYKDGVEMVVRGAHFISVEDPSYIGDYMPEFTALVGPMLYRNYDEYTQLIRTPLIQGWVKQIEEKGIKILSLEYLFGFRNLITDRVIRAPKDLRGVKLRTPGSKLFIETINAMGATATPLPWGETFSAVQQGVVDGLEGSEFTNLSTRAYETGKTHVARTNHFLGTCGMYISTSVWNQIPATYQEIIQTEINLEAQRMINVLKSKHSAVVIELESHGVTFNEVDRAAFEAQTQSVFKKIPGITIKVYHQLQAELSKIRSK